MAWNSRQIGSLEVSAIGMGGAHWSLWGTRDDEASTQAFNTGIDSGITFIDTAHRYTYTPDFCHNEWIIQKAIANEGWSSPVQASEIVVATKGGHRYDSGEGDMAGDPATIRGHAEESLRTLKVDCLDLYYLHWPDPNVPVEESMGAIEQLRQEGKVREVGVSNFTREQLDRVLPITPVRAVQNKFNPGHQPASEHELIRYTNSLGIAYVPYSPLGGTFPPTELKPTDERLVTLASEVGVSVPVLVLTWHLNLSPNMIPLVGSRRASSIADSAKVLTAAIPADVTEAVAAILTEH